MKTEVDQSDRIEETNRATVIALASKDHSITLQISAKVKRQLLEHFRRRGKPKLFPVVIFASAIAMILKKSKLTITDLVIDDEYPGHEKIIESIIKQRLPTAKLNIQFQKIGKKSYAHYAAYGVFMKRRNANWKATFRELNRRLKTN